MDAVLTQYCPGWYTILALLGLSYAAGHRQAAIAAARRMRRTTRSDEGRTGHISAIWRDADDLPVCTVVLEPRSTSPSLLVLCWARMPSCEWREGQDIVVLNGRVQPRDRH